MASGSGSGETKGKPARPGGPQEGAATPQAGAAAPGGGAAGGGQTGGTGGALGAGFGAMPDFTRIFADFKLPAMPDMQAVMDAHRRNMEALSAANRVALEGAQAVAQRHVEIMQQTMAELAEAMQALASSDAPQDKAAKQTEMLRRAYERAAANMRELSELIQRSNTEALHLLNQRFSAAMEEVRGLMDKAGKPGA